MKERYLAWVLLLFTSLSVFALAALLISLQQTRTQYSDNAPLMVNLLLQTNHAIDQFENSLQSLQKTKNSAELNDLKVLEGEKNVRFQFEILWTSLKDFNFQIPEEYALSELTETAKKDVDDFLTSNDPLMSPSYSLTEQDIDSLLLHSNETAYDIRQLGRVYFFSSVEKADSVKQQISNIIKNIVLYVCLLLITGGCAIGWLYYNNRRTSKLFNDAKNSRTELAETVDELRSGKREQKAKDTFIASASHDLRQPLHALGIFLNTLDDNITTGGRKALTGAQSCTEDLNRLFNSLLDLSQLDAGIVKVENEDFNLRKSLSRLHAELTPKARTFGINMSVVFYGNDSFAHSDPVLIDRIVRNLIENAIVHSHATNINLACNCLQKSWEISIGDNGCGIPKSEHEAIFSEYYQLQNPERDRSKGLGLGLSIVKRLTSLLNVELDISSDAETGTLFKIIVPKSHFQPSLNHAMENKVSTLDYSQVAGSVIVVIDDDSNIREAMHMILTKHAAIPICGETSDEVLEALAEKQLAPDFIIADYRLRDHLTGDMVITHLREAVEILVPALIITGDTSPSRMASLKESGLDIMHKPIEAEPLFEKIMTILSRDSDHDEIRTPATS